MAFAESKPGTGWRERASSVRCVISCRCRDVTRSQASLAQTGNLPLLCVDNSTDAIETLKTHIVQLILSEIDIGTIDGWRFARLVRANVLKCTETTPIILLSSTYCERITETTARAYGINLVLPASQLTQLPQVVQRFQQTALQSQPRPAILIVEDDQDIAELARRIVQTHFDVVIATTGPQALALIPRRVLP